MDSSKAPSRRQEKTHQLHLPPKVLTVPALSTPGSVSVASRGATMCGHLATSATISVMRGAITSMQMRPYQSTHHHISFSDIRANQMRRRQLFGVIVSWGRRIHRGRMYHRRGQRGLDRFSWTPTDQTFVTGINCNMGHQAACQQLPLTTACHLHRRRVWWCVS